MAASHFICCRLIHAYVSFRHPLVFAFISWNYQGLLEHGLEQATSPPLCGSLSTVQPMAYHDESNFCVFVSELQGFDFGFFFLHTRCGADAEYTSVKQKSGFSHSPHTTRAGVRHIKKQGKCKGPMSPCVLHFACLSLVSIGNQPVKVGPGIYHFS